MLEEEIMSEEELNEEDLGAAAATPIARSVSGLYRIAVTPGMPRIAAGEELRLDVDGRYPQMVASGAIPLTLQSRVDWIAALKTAGTDAWKGKVTYKNGAVASFPYTEVSIKVTGGLLPSQRTATVIFSGGGGAVRTRKYTFKSAYFHPVEFEFDSVEGTTAVTSIQTHAHPNRPATLPSETLNIEKVFQRAGFQVALSPGASTIPFSNTGPNNRWSDAEMHDAMQAFWSRFANKPQWAMWVLFASLHDQGTSLGGVMFDDIGPNHRQGTAIFQDAFIANAPNGDPSPAAWVQRMRFWTACHEMGHAFNLAHSWQKSLTFSGLGPWIPLADEPEARSFMNYPYNVAGGQSAFFADFPFRFSNPELLFMRHAPASFVQMGNADWFDHHGFQQAAVSQEPRFQMILRVNRDRPVFEFMEPVMAELKLTNVSSEPQLVRENALANLDGLTIISKRQGMPARQLIPYAHYCAQMRTRVLEPGQSLYESIFLSVGRNGWDLAEPGNYTVQAALHLPDEDVISQTIRLRISPARGHEEEVVAQDFFSDEVGRALTFDGTRTMTSATKTLNELVEKLPETKAAIHARIPLANVNSKPYKQLDFGDKPTQKTVVLQVEPNVEEAKQEYSAALTSKMEVSADTLGHVDLKDYTDKFTDFLAAYGDPKQAAKIQDQLLKVMKARGVLERVLEEIAARRDQYEGKRAAAAKG